MPQHKASELMKKHNLNAEDIRERRTSLHHLRNIVRSEDLPFDVFRELVKLRR